MVSKRINKRKNKRLEEDKTKKRMSFSLRNLKVPSAYWFNMFKASNNNNGKFRSKCIQ